MMSLPPCPQCGRETGVSTKSYLRGSAIHYYNEWGEFEEMSLDGIRTERAGLSIRCDGCNVKRKDLKFDPRTNTITVKKPSRSTL